MSGDEAAGFGEGESEDEENEAPLENGGAREKQETHRGGGGEQREGGQRKPRRSSGVETGDFEDADDGEECRRDGTPDEPPHEGRRLRRRI